MLKALFERFNRLFRPSVLVEHQLFREYEKKWELGLPPIEKLKPGDIIVDGEMGNWISYLIRQVTRSPFSHTRVYVGSGRFVHTTIGGTREGELREVYEKIKRRELWASAYRIKGITEEQRKGIVEFARRHIGARPYDYLQLLWLGFTYALGLRDVTNATVRKRAWICTELIARAARSQGLKLHDWLHVTEIAPHEVARSKYVERIKP